MKTAEAHNQQLTGWAESTRHHVAEDMDKELRGLLHEFLRVFLQHDQQQHKEIKKLTYKLKKCKCQKK